MALLKIVATFLALYLTWATVLSDNFFHRIWSLALFALLVLLTLACSLPFSPLTILLVLLAFLDALLCIALSPAQLLLHRGQTLDQEYEALEIFTSRNNDSDDGGDQNIVADIVAVHGLASNPNTAWQFDKSFQQTRHRPRSTSGRAEYDGAAGKEFSRPEATPTNPMWLRDFLPKEGLDARIMAFNHNTAWETNALSKSLEDYGQDLLCALGQVRLTDKEKTRPIIFIGHSFGGIIIKKALAIASDYKDDDFRYNIHKQAKGFVFLGTPHKGARVTIAGKIIALFGYWSGSSTNLLETIAPKSTLNQELHERFMRSHGIKKIICVFEAARESFWGIPLMHVVEKDSAAIDISEKIGFEEKHRDLQRFASREDKHYKDILFWIREMVVKVSEANTSRVQAQLASITSEQQKCLQSLSFKEMDLQQHDITTASPSTCAWLLKHKEYDTWRRQRHELLWIKGIPGAGKSTLMKYAVQEYMKQESRNDIVASFFFHGRGVPLQKIPLGLFRSLLYQILTRIRPLLSEFQLIFKKKRETQGEPGKDWNWHVDELQDFIKCNVAKTGYPIRIFIDALDECGEKAARELVSYFQQLTSATGSVFSICFSCRHYPLIALSNGLEICVEDENQQDILAYVRVELEIISEEQGEEAEILENEIVNRASGVFQWVALVAPLMRSLHEEGKPVKDIQKELLTVPTELHELYQEILKTIKKKDLPQTLHLMQWVCLAVRPLSLTELRFAMSFDRPYQSHREWETSSDYVESDARMEKLVRTLSGGLAEVKHQEDQHTVQFIHQSVNDFLIQVGLRNLDPSSKNSSVGQGHHLLSRSCINYTTMEDVSQSKREVGQFDLVRRFPFLEYATTFWVLHAQKAESEKISQSGLSARFGWPSGHILQRWIDIYRVIDTWAANCPDHQATLLHVASGHGLLSTVKELLLEKTANFDQEDSDGRSPLSYAAERGHEAVMKLLLKKGVNVDSRSKKHGRTPLSYAAENGHEVVAKLLLEKAVDVNSKSWYGQTPLSYAARNGHEVVVKLLLLEKAETIDMNSKDGYSQTPLLWAARNGHETVVKLLLLEKAVDIDSKDDRYRRTPLSYAAENGHEAVVKLLLEKAVSIDSKDYKYRRTPLSWAAENGHEMVVKLLLEKAVDVDSMDEYGRTPLTWATRNGHEAVVRLLLEKAVDVDSKDGSGQTPLSWAARNGHEAVVKLLLEKAVDMDFKDDKYGQTPLSYAARNGHEAVVKLLLEKAVDVDSMDEYGRTPLTWAARNGHDAVVRLLLETAVDVDSKDGYDRTPLSWATRNGHEAVAKLLLEKADAVDVNSKDGYGRTPLSWATRNGHGAVVKLLLEKAVDVDSKDGYGQTPLSWAAENGHEVVAKLLLEKTVDVDSKDEYGQTPLSWAAENGHAGVVKLLLEKAADVNCKDGYGRTPLSYAARNGHEAVVKLLLEKAVDVNVKEDGYGRTPLSWAAEIGHAGVVKLLLEKAVDVDSKDGYGRTPLSRAAENGHDAVAKLLLEKADAVDVNSKSRKDGRTPLSYAAEKGRKVVVKLLLEKAEDIDVNSKSRKYGRTPLSYAAEDGHEAVVKLLLEKAIDVDSKDGYGQTPLSYAARNEHEAVVKLLKSKAR